MSKFEQISFAMTLIIDKNNVNDLPKLLASRLKRKSKKSSLSKHFGKLKRELDGLEYQQKMRENESWFSRWYEFTHLYTRRKPICFSIFKLWICNFIYFWNRVTWIQWFKCTSWKKLIALIDDCWCIEWNAEIKAQTINLRKKYKIKLPDAIIAATAITYELPLVSADQGFSQIEELDFILLNFD